jgi:hypothetical protein
MLGRDGVEQVEVDAVVHVPRLEKLLLVQAHSFR